MNSLPGHASREENRLQLVLRARQVFTPGAPINEYELFAGRKEQIRRAMDAVAQVGQHVIIFGERGVGKTSLANAVMDLVRKEGYVTARVNCNTDDSFLSLWQRALRDVELEVRARKIGFALGEQTSSIPLSRFLEDNASPDDIRYLLQKFGSRAVIVFDEMDRLKDRALSRWLADTVKSLSDNTVPTTLVLVGVADTVDELIAEHASIERSLVQIQMPRMSSPELEEIIDRRLQRLGLEIQQEARSRIVSLSQGLPHYTHLLAMHAVLSAIDARRNVVTKVDVEVAITRAVEDAHQSILEAYHRATGSPRRNSLYPQVLLACALAKKDELGYFYASHVRDPMTRLMGKRYDIPAFARHLNDFCETKRGPVLQKTGRRRSFRFRFINPLLQPFVILHGLSKGLVTEDMLTNA